MRLVKLLYVEDDPTCAELFKSGLPLDMQEGHHQYFVDTARTIEIARALTGFTPYDAIFVDHTLQDNGRAGVTLLREFHDAGFKIPLVLLSEQEEVDNLDPETARLIRAGKIVQLSKEELNRGNIESLVEYVLGRSIRLLHVEDDEDDAHIAREMLEDARPIRFEMTQVRTLDEANSRLDDGEWDVIVLDWLLRGEAGTTTTEPLVQRLLESPDSPSLLILSGQCPDMLSESVVRLIGRRKISFCSKERLNTTRLVNTIMAQRNGQQAMQAMRGP